MLRRTIVGVSKRRRDRRVSLKLNHFAARCLEALARDGVPQGAEPRPLNRVIGELLVEAARLRRCTPANDTSDTRDTRHDDTRAAG